MRYRFQCEKCGNIEVFYWNMKDVKKMSKKVGACKVCGGKMNRIFECGGIHFKGNGFTKRIR